MQLFVIKLKRNRNKNLNEKRLFLLKSNTIFIEKLKLLKEKS